jgi:hypothetical protein
MMEATIPLRRPRGKPELGSQPLHARGTDLPDFEIAAGAVRAARLAIARLVDHHGTQDPAVALLWLGVIGLSDRLDALAARAEEGGRA